MHSKCVNYYPKIDNLDSALLFSGLGGADLSKVGADSTQPGAQSKWTGSGALEIDPADGTDYGTPIITDFQQFVISVNTGSATSLNVEPVFWDAVCSFDTPTYEVKLSYGSRLYSTALCSTTDVTVGDAVFPTALTFTLDPYTCELEYVRVVYGNIFSEGTILRSSTGYIASPEFPGINKR